MVTKQQWDSLVVVKKTDFRYPESMAWPIVQNIDRLAQRLESKPMIISDYRPNDLKQHGIGTAVDTVWPGLDPLTVWNEARAMKLFTGLGVYLNQLNAVSFHFDNRLDRTVNNPALWGDFISTVYDPDLGQHVRKDEYTGVDVVIDMIKKKLPGTALGLILFALGIWILVKK
jgi:hypothetical protein